MVWPWLAAATKQFEKAENENRMGFVSRSPRIMWLSYSMHFNFALLTFAYVLRFQYFISVVQIKQQAFFAEISITKIAFLLSASISILLVKNQWRNLTPCDWRTYLGAYFASRLYTAVQMFALSLCLDLIYAFFKEQKPSGCIISTSFLFMGRVSFYCVTLVIHSFFNSHSVP